MSPNLDSLPVAIVLLCVASVVIVLAAPRMVQVSDRLADVTGLGEALVGAVLLGAATSLPDLVATVTPALRGLPQLAVGNALGGVFGQTAFLAVADLAYRRANLEHAAASLPNLLQATLLAGLLGGVLALLHGPQISVLGVHVGTPLLLVLYLYGLSLTSDAVEHPMWRAVDTTETRQDEPEEPQQGGQRLRELAVRFAGLAVVLGVAGWVVGRSGETIAEATPISQTGVGVGLTGLASSLPELVVSVSAVRSGALTMAVGNIIGGNTFDTLLVGVADVAYRGGPVYAEVGGEPSLVAAMGLLATTLLLLDMLRRARHGFAGIGATSALVLVIYGVTIFAIL